MVLNFNIEVQMKSFLINLQNLITIMNLGIIFKRSEFSFDEHLRLRKYVKKYVLCMLCFFRGFD